MELNPAAQFADTLVVRISSRMTEAIREASKGRVHGDKRSDLVRRLLKEALDKRGIEDLSVEEDVVSRYGRST